MKAKTTKTISEWIEMFSLHLLFDRPAIKCEDLIKDLKAMVGVKHDDLVALEKKMQKSKQSIKATCKEMFPKSTYFQWYHNLNVNFKH